MKRLYPHQQGRRETHHRSRKQRPPDILKEAEGSGFKYGGLAFFRVKAFDDAPVEAGQRKKNNVLERSVTAAMGLLTKASNKVDRVS